MERTDNHKSVRLRQNQQTHSGRSQVGPALGDHYRAGCLAPSAQCGFFGRVDSQLSRRREREISGMYSDLRSSKWGSRFNLACCPLTATYYRQRQRRWRPLIVPPIAIATSPRTIFSICCNNFIISYGL